MSCSVSKHAAARFQQRGISTEIDELLDLYGEEYYDGRGARILLLSRASLDWVPNDLKQSSGAALRGRSGFYKVVSCRDGALITIGHRYSKIRRK